MYTHNGTATFSEDIEVPEIVNGTHRLRLALDRQVITTTAVFSIDVNYAGGAFVADHSSPALDVSNLYGGDGWPSEPARIYFGGDDDTVFRDFQVTVTGPPVVLGDFNGDGAVNSMDWGILRSNQETDLSGLSLQDAYFRGDLNKDLANEHADFVSFKALYDSVNGAGAFTAMLAAVPEPSTAGLILSAGFLALPVARRAASNSYAAQLQHRLRKSTISRSTPDESYELA
jgi:hypothetical protein